MTARDILLNNLRWKLAALVLAVFVWFIIQFGGFAPPEHALSPALQDHTFRRMPVLALVAPGDDRQFQMTPEIVDVTVKLRFGDLKRPIEKSIKVFVNLVDRPDFTEDIASVYAYAPPGIEIVKIDPPDVSVKRIPASQ